MAKESLADRIYREVKQEIKDGKITAEDCIVENDICKNHEVSKATAGEVLHRLTQEGILKSYPRKGYMLNIYSVDDFMRIQNLRFAIETLVVHQLVCTVDSERIRKTFKHLEDMDNITFHSTMAKLLEDPFVEDTLDNLLTKASNSFDHIDFEDGADEIIRYRHHQIIDAILNQDEACAVEALRVDLRLMDAENPIGDIGRWNMQKSFQTSTMSKIIYLSDPQMSSDGRYSAVVQYKANAKDGKFYSNLAICNIKKEETEVYPCDGNVKNPRFCENGGFLAYLSDKSGEFQIYYVGKDKIEHQVTTLRHGVKQFQVSEDGTNFVFEAKLWEQEVEQNRSFTEMSEEEKQQWKNEREWAPQEITQIDYKQDEFFGVRDGSISYIGLANITGKQKLLTEKISCFCPVISPKGDKIACYGMPHTGALYSKRELFLMDIDGQNMVCLTDGMELEGETPVCFSEDGTEIVYPAYMKGEGDTMILYLYKTGDKQADSICLFDEDAEEVSSGVYGLPLLRTQYGQEKPYFQVVRNQVYFLCAWQGTERLYEISLKGKSIPKVLLEGDYSIHEFCKPVKGNMLLTRGDYHSLRDLYLYQMKTGKLIQIQDSNPWMREYDQGEVAAYDVPVKTGIGSVHGWVCKPARFNKDKKYPAILYVHGGPTASYTNDFWHEIQILANAGYVVVYCDPRGSFGYGKTHSSGRYAWGTEACEDLMTFLDFAVSLGFIDENRLGITGGSYGGYMTCKMIMQTDRFAAAVGQRIFVNKATSYGTGDMGFYTAGQEWSSVKIKECLLQRARTSIIKDMDRIKTPLLLLHGQKDYRCSFEQAEQMFISMKERRKEVPVKLVMFPNENHGLTRTGLLHFQQRHIQEMLDWFNQYLKGEDKDEVQ